jgi:hypothetical protein
MHRKIIACIVLCLIVQIGFGQIKGSLWDVEGIYKVPHYNAIQRDGVLEIIYEGLPYKGHNKKTFAYYATPGILQGDISLDKHLPAVVLAHGGGGTAFY